MRFGSFVFPVSHVPGNDGSVIDDALREVEMVEALGLDAVWLTEHHFSGEVAYVDPVVFGAAVAVRTSRVKIGFAVVEMALHHPVRLAAQTALLDNLSHGRLIVGTGRGTAFNHFEYTGFGLTMQDGLEMMDEAEDLLIKAWTSDSLEYEGRHWKVSMSLLRPRPYQKPHPPLARACLSEASVVAMAGIGRPILLAPLADDVLGTRLEQYRIALLEGGHEESAAGILDQVWVTKNMVVASTHEEATRIVEEGFTREFEHAKDARQRLNPPGTAAATATASGGDGRSLRDMSIFGTPRQVADHVAALRDLGVPNLMLKFNIGEMRTSEVEQSMRLFAEEVRPLLG